MLMLHLAHAHLGFVQMLTLHLCKCSQVTFVQIFARCICANVHVVFLEMLT